MWIAVSAALVRDARGEPDYFVNMIEGIAERKRMQQDLQHLAHHDGLTGLPNRDLFYDRLELALDQARRRNWTIGVMFIAARSQQHHNRAAARLSRTHGIPGRRCGDGQRSPHISSPLVKVRPAPTRQRWPSAQRTTALAA